MANDSRIGPSVAVPGLNAVIAYVNTLKAGLFTDNAIPADWKQLSAYSPPFNDLYALAPVLFVPVPPLDGPIYKALASPIEFQSNPLNFQQLVNGWFLYDEGLAEVVVALLYNSNQPYIRTGPFWIEAELSTFFSVFS